jgi:hypothetical protein
MIEASFDYITYNNQIFKSTSTPNQNKSCYEISDNKLWLKRCTLELAEAINDPFGGYSVNEEHSKILVNYTGVIKMYDIYKEKAEFINFNVINGIIQQLSGETHD